MAEEQLRTIQEAEEAEAMGALTAVQADGEEERDDIAHEHAMAMVLEHQMAWDH